MDGPKTLKDLLDRLDNDAAARAEFKQDPFLALAGLASREKAPAHSDTFIYRFVVVVLGVVVLAIAALEIGAHIQFIFIYGKEPPKVPDFLIFIGSTSLGALAGLLAPVPTSKAGGG